MPLEIIRQDITKLRSDAIVNAANAGLEQGGGVCGAIFAAAGAREMRQACAAIGHCPLGKAVITPGFALPARYVIHAVGPVWQGGGHGEEAALRSAYRSSLELARDNNLESIAFPLISSGIYGYPREEAFAIALDEIQRFLLEHEMQVQLVVFDRKSTLLGQKVQSSLQSYIDDHYVDEHYFQRLNTENLQRNVPQYKELASAPLPVFQPEETFSQARLRLIDTKGLTDAQAYKRANIDRKHFSKIRSNKAYAPSKRTVLAFTIALELNFQEAEMLLERAGFAFSPAFVRDLIVRWFIEQGKANIHEVNAALFEYEQELLGA